MITHSFLVLRMLQAELEFHDIHRGMHLIEERITLLLRGRDVLRFTYKMLQVFRRSDGRRLH